MIPLLAPLLGSLAGSLLPATLGSGIAGALGLKGAAGALVASAAPKAIGAGIGTLLAGGDLGDAALNAVGFGAAGSLLAGAGSTGAPATSPRPTMRPDTLVSSMPAPAVVPTAATEAASTAALPNLARSAQQIAEALGGGQQSQPPSPLPINRPPRQSAMDNPLLAPLFQTGPTLDGPMSTPATVPVVGGPSMMPASVGIGTIPMGGQAPMSNDMMLAGMSPNQSNMVNEYLRSRNMVGFA
jgi:hypothetical protein